MAEMNRSNPTAESGRSRRIKLAAVGVAPLIAVLAGCNQSSKPVVTPEPVPTTTVHHDQVTPEQKAAAAQSIAHGLSCMLTAVEDSKKQPDRSVLMDSRDSGSRTTLTVGVSVTYNAESVLARKVFAAQDSGVDWDGPSLIAGTSGRSATMFNPGTDNFHILSREIRAFAGWPASRMTIGGKDVIITAAHVETATSSKAAGSGWRDGKQFGFYTTDGILVIDQIKPVGKPAMSAEAFVAGYSELLRS